MNNPENQVEGQPAFEALGTATYCPEDNKLRFYPFARLDTEDFQRIKATGFKWAPKQELFVAPKWTPKREDLMLEWCGEIDDEDETPEDRAAARAARFAMYRDKRRAEAHGFAGAYEAGPDAYGNQNAQRAERQAARRDRVGGRACTQWSKAEYWQSRTVSVIGHALHKSSPRVRRGRILVLEADQRKYLSGLETRQAVYDAWKRVLELDGLDEAIKFDDECKPVSMSKAVARAYKLAANSTVYCGDYKHPRTGEESSIYDHLINPADPITAREAVMLSLGNGSRPEIGRWGHHYELRLAYERQMLEAEGGSAGNVEMVPGGMLGKYLIIKVNKSNATGAVVSVNVWLPKEEGDGWDYRRRGDTMLINIQKMGESVYSPPTDESLANLREVLAREKAKNQKANASKPKLINPTNEDAERLQAELNRIAYEARINGPSRHVTGPKPTKVVYMTQSQYSQLSKGAYARYETRDLHAGPKLGSEYSYSSRDRTPVVCKLRIGPREDFTKPTGIEGMVQVIGSTDAPSIVVITDKPQKPLPDWSEVKAEEVAK